ncbi:MAG: FecR domain-containing protein [Mangrovibacterium sp.]|nr:FecR domain-containing protein [Mangrovibacterium sp.]
MTDGHRIYELADKWLKGTITEKEKQGFEEWYNREAKQHPEWTRDPDEQSMRDRLYRSILRNIEPREKGSTLLISRRRQFYKWSSVAAALVVLFVTGIWFFQYHDFLNHLQDKESHLRVDLPPGREAATLILADGSVIDLDTIQNGEVTVQGKTIIRKQGGQVAYVPSTEKEKMPVLYNTINTARGHQYQLVLPDSTRVWLNSASSLYYPAAFSGDARLVELTGEAYFEVARNASTPFLVKVNGVEVEVLGTRFNIHAYTDEGAVETTLLEGSVNVKNEGRSVLIMPGEQAVIRSNKAEIGVSEADLDQVMAWQKGFFEFDNTELPAIMRQISRWYDVDIRYEGQPGTKKFGGRISKNLNMSDVLALLEANGVRFVLDGKTLTVRP